MRLAVSIARPHKTSMEWTDDGIILGSRRHGEDAVVLEAMTARHGRHLGLVRGGRGLRLGALIQPGNKVGLTWRARLDEHLGVYSVEAIALKAGSFLETPASLFGLSHLAGLIRLLPERDPHEAVFDALEVVLEHLHEPVIAAALLIRLELALLSELGFGLDLSRCAVTGGTQELVFVSPKSGRAVTRRAGADYADRLLALPAFVRDGAASGALSLAELRSGFDLTGHFLARHVYEPRGLAADERQRYLDTMFRDQRPDTR